MSADKNINYFHAVKNHVRMRLLESNWNIEVINITGNAISKRLKAGQNPRKIKFEELYKDIIDKARDAISIKMEQECHLKVKEYLSLNLDELTASIVSSDVLPPGGSSGVSMDVAAKKMDAI